MNVNFFKKMMDIFGEETEEYGAAFDSAPFRGLCVNTLKCSVNDFQKIAPFELFPSSFSPGIFYFSCGEMSAGNHPYHRAGLYYIQEPSAAAPVEVLGVQPGEFVLDLCASPGGKSAQIAEKLNGMGLVWSNEYVANRVQPLLSNIERLGIRNAIVSNSHPATFCEKMQGCFDRVLVDAPCSGEGMFRKNPEAAIHWSEEHVRSCAVRQLSILNSAAGALRDGGILVYSTCTFSPEENEEVVGSFLRQNPQFELLPITLPFGRPGLKGKMVDTPEYVKRIFPMDGGEGQFMAKFKKAGDMPRSSLPLATTPPVEKKKRDLFLRFAGDNLTADLSRQLMIVNDSVYIPPPEAMGVMGGIVRSGVLAGSIVKDRFVPSHQFYLALQPGVFRQKLNFSPNDPVLTDYLKGCEIKAPEGLSGYVVVCADHFALGFGKASDGRLKNHYPKGLRLF